MLEVSEQIKITLFTAYTGARGGDLVAATRFIKEIIKRDPNIKITWVVKRDISGYATNFDKFLEDHPEAKCELDKIGALVEGFETPYGMELLASVHWIATHDKSAKDVEETIQQLNVWSDRKKRLFKSEHVRTAWNRLEAEGELSAACSDNK